ncbi:MAG: uroporphyrinogen decarboxylase family protein [Armatimonadota bacterium]|nr:uroporphyrinogen decarboxylase family protein [Armatimonadota bacterium]
MERSFYLQLAQQGLRMPIGTDLVLHEKPDVQGILVDGHRLGQVVEEAARRYRTPLAIPHMDLMIEKTALLELLGVPAEQIPTYHFSEPPSAEMVETVRRRLHESPLNVRIQAQAGSVAYIAQHTDLLPIGMTIGPFSLMTKLIADPIAPIYLAGMGVTGEEDPEVKMIETTLELSMMVILRSMQAQIEAGARAMFIAEPAANRVYISPKQIEQGSDVFERMVMRYLRRVKAFLDERGVDLIFHCCGELTDQMVQQYASLEPVILSLGSSRVLWEDARLVPKHVVLFGNLPSKRFYSDELVTREQVEQLACELIARMREVGHPFILGSECDVLSVAGCEQTIKEKVQAFIECKC